MSAVKDENQRALNILAEKLGVTDKIIINKATEVLRLMDTKNSTSLSGSLKAVISLELASQLKGWRTNKELAIKLAGVSKRNYLQQLYTMERLLDLQPPTNIHDICISLACIELSEPAQRLLNRHKQLSNEWSAKDHPMYVAGAIFTVAKHQKVSIDKNKLMHLGRTRARQLETVYNLMTKTLETMGGMKKKKQIVEIKKSVIDNILSKADTEENNQDEKGKIATENADEEDFETWKLRMLSEADD